ncbi:MAG: hypothetical protein AAF311_00330 [Pseudomonadota bacterium]
MTDLRKIALLSVAVLAAAFMLEGCGGGGSSAPPPPPPPPPPVNTAPTIAIAKSTPDVDENAQLVLDASGSTDADGDALSFEWTQTAGPDTTLSGTDQAVMTVSPPFVDEDAELQFKLVLSDGEDTVEETVGAMLRNVILGRAYNNDSKTVLKPWDDAGTPKTVWWGHVGFETPMGEIEFKQPILDPRKVDTFLTYQDASRHAQGTFPKNTIFKGPKSRMFSIGHEPDDYLDTADDQIDGIILMPDTDEVVVRSRIYKLRQPVTDLESPPLAVDAPCDASVVSRYHYWKDFNEYELDSSTFEGIVVSRSGGGFSMFEGKLDGETLAYLPLSIENNPTGSFCAIVATNRYIDERFTRARTPAPLHYGPLIDTYDKGGNLILAVADDGRSATLFNSVKAVGSDAVTLSALETVEIDLDTNEPLDLVDAQTLGAVSVSGAEAGLALVYTDGEEMGTHRLVLIGVGSDGKILQHRKSWDRGVPTFVRQVAVHRGMGTSHTLVYPSPEIVVGLDEQDSFLAFRSPGFERAQPGSFFETNSVIIDFNRVPLEEAAYMSSRAPLSEIYNVDFGTLIRYQLWYYPDGDGADHVSYDYPDPD